MLVRLLVCFLFLQLNSLAQTPLDSLRNIWQNEELSDSTRFRAILEQYSAHSSELDENISLSNYHFQLAQKKGSIEQKIKALHYKAVFLYNKGELDHAKKILEKELKLANETKKPLDMMNVLMLKSGIALDERDFLTAIKSINEGKRIASNNGLKQGEITCLINSAGFHELIGNYDLSIQFLDDAEEKSNAINYTNYLGLIWMNKGTTFQGMDNQQEAIKFSLKALDFFKKQNNRFQQASCYFTLASAHNQLKQYTEALNYVEKCLAIDESYNYELRTIESLVLKANILLPSDTKMALEIGKDVLSRVTDDTPYDIQKSVYELLFNCHKREGNFQRALEFHELYSLSLDSMTAEETQFAAVREVVKYEFELELLDTKLTNQREKSQLKLAQLKKNYLIISISVLLVLLLTLFFRLKVVRMRQKREALLRELAELKMSKQSNLVMDTQAFSLNREKIETSINRKLNETDWKVLQVLLEDPIITNKEMASRVFLSEDGLGSSLRRMYDYFGVKETKYKKIALLMNAIKRGKE